MSDLQSAILISAQAHHGQKRKNGLPYLLHPIRVMLRMKTEAEMIVAILHDVVEDTVVTLDDLRAKGFSDDVLAALDLLTKRKGQAYEEYIAGISRNPLARAVKIEDLQDNMNLGEIPQVTEKDLARIEKYRKALNSLESGSKSGGPAKGEAGITANGNKRKRRIRSNQLDPNIEVVYEFVDVGADERERRLREIIKLLLGPRKP